MQKYSFIFALVTALFVGCTDTATDDFDCGCAPAVTETPAETAPAPVTTQAEETAAAEPVASEAPAAPVAN